MTKVSWKRILQRAGNDLPNHGRSFAEGPRVHSLSRGPRPAADSPSQIGGELEMQLRNALQRAQNATSSGPEEPSWDPIYMAREMRHTPPAVPVTNYRPVEAKKKSSTARNIIAVSLSAAVFGFAAHQVGTTMFGGGGGGDGGGSDDQQQSQSASVAGPIAAREQKKLVETGYAIQPIVHPANPVDLAPPQAQTQAQKEAPSPAATEKSTARLDNGAPDAAAIFQRDMEDAVRLFEDKHGTAPITTTAAPELAPEPQKAPVKVARADPATEPQKAPVKVARVDAAPAPALSSSPPKVSAVATPAPGLPELTGAEEDALLQRASGLMKRGDVTGARLLFEHLAYRGSALGAFALAQSYDPKYLKKIYVRGLTPDQKQADFWYRRAAELGNVAR